MFHDFRNRVSLGRFSLIRSLPDHKWQQALRALVVEKRDQIDRSDKIFQRIIKEDEIEEVIGHEGRLNADDIETCLSEITEGQLFKKVGRGRYEPEPRLIQYALGALLLEEVVEKLESGLSSAEQRLAEFCEPLSGADFLASIVGAAAAIALLSGQHCTEQAKVLLLATWADTQNAEVTTMFAAYARTAPDTYLEVAELLNTRSALKGQGGDFILDALLRVRDIAEYQPRLVSRFLFWSGWDNRLLALGDLETVALRDLCENRNIPMPHQSGVIGGELRKIAFAVIRQGPQLRWVDVVLASCFAAVVDHKTGAMSDVTWTVRLNRHDPVEVKAEIQSLAESLRQSSELFIEATGAVLLALLGGPVEETSIDERFFEGLRQLSMPRAAYLVEHVGGKRPSNALYPFLDPAATFKKSSIGLETIADFATLIRSARMNPTAISRITALAVKALDECFNPGPDGIEFSELQDWDLPAVIMAPLLRKGIETIELALSRIAAALTALGVTASTIGRLDRFVELLFKLSSPSKRTGLRASWQFDLDQITAEESWNRIDQSDGSKNIVLDLDGAQIFQSEAFDQLRDWDKWSSRARALLLASLSGDDVSNTTHNVVAERWSWPDSNTGEEQVYGALLLARDRSLPFDQIVSRLPPIFWAVAVVKRGSVAHEVRHFQLAIDDWMTTAGSFPAFDCATSSTLQALQNRADKDAYRNLIDQNLEAISTLVQAKGPEASQWGYVLRERAGQPDGEFVRFVHCLLIRALAKSDRKLAEALWHSFFDAKLHRLAPMRNTSDFLHGLTSEIPLSHDDWLQKALSYYDNDFALYELVVYCHRRVAKREWLLGVIERDYASPSDWQKARGRALAGFCAPDVGRAFLDSCQKGWVGISAGEAVNWHRRSEFSRHWYESYLREPGTVKAVANLALYLASVDARAAFWRKGAEQGALDARLQHCRLFQQSVAEFERSNILELKGQYLGWPIGAGMRTRDR